MEGTYGKVFSSRMTESSERFFDSFGVSSKTSVWHFNVVFWAIVWVSHCQWHRWQSFSEQPEVLLAMAFGSRADWMFGRVHTLILGRYMEVGQKEWGLNWKQSSLPLCTMPFSVITMLFIVSSLGNCMRFVWSSKADSGFCCSEACVRPLNPGLKYKLCPQTAYFC